MIPQDHVIGIGSSRELLLLDTVLEFFPTRRFLLTFQDYVIAVGTQCENVALSGELNSYQQTLEVADGQSEFNS